MKEKAKKVDKKEQHVVSVDTKQIVENKDNELNSRINRLFGEQEEQVVVKKYDSKDLIDVRKKMFFLFILVVIIGFVAIVLLLSPIDFENNKKTENNVENNNSNNNEENEEKLSVNDLLVTELNNTIMFDTGDFQEIDLFPLFAVDTVVINNTSNDIKLHLIKRSSAFYDLLKQKGADNYVNTCNPAGFVIEKNEFDSMVKKVLGPDAKIEYKPINYIYKNESNITKKITINYENEQFVVKCNSYISNDQISKFVQQKIVDVEKIENGIEIYQKVVFISRNGVFKDTSFTTLITNDINATFEQYINDGNIYKYTFINNEDSYYLEKIELVKEDK